MYIPTAPHFDMQLHLKQIPTDTRSLVTCADPRVFPETFLRLNVGEALIFRTVAGHPQPVLEDLAALDVEFDSSFEHVMIIYHTGQQYSKLELTRLEGLDC